MLPPWWDRLQAGLPARPPGQEPGGPGDKESLGQEAFLPICLATIFRVKYLNWRKVHEKLSYVSTSGIGLHERCGVFPTGRGGSPPEKRAPRPLTLSSFSSSVLPRVHPSLHTDTARGAQQGQRGPEQSLRQRHASRRCRGVGGAWWWEDWASRVSRGTGAGAGPCKAVSVVALQLGDQ